MKIQISPQVFHTFHPQFRLAVITATGLDNKSKLKQSQRLLQEAVRLVQLTFNKDTVKSHHLIAPWEAIRQEFGKEARHYQTSLEILLRRVVMRKSITSQDTLTNILRYLSLKYLVPIGADDADKINGSITFTLSKGTKRVQGKKLSPGMVYYHDKQSILGTKLDFWKNPKTALRFSSTSALIHLEALPPITNTRINEITVEAARLIQTFCGGTVTVVGLDKKRKTAEI